VEEEIFARQKTTKKNAMVINPTLVQSRRPVSMRGRRIPELIRSIRCNCHTVVAIRPLHSKPSFTLLGAVQVAQPRQIAAKPASPAPFFRKLFRTEQTMPRSLHSSPSRRNKKDLGSRTRAQLQALRFDPRRGYIIVLTI
jgi:hypothetical protein